MTDRLSRKKQSKLLSNCKMAILSRNSCTHQNYGLINALWFIMIDSFCIIYDLLLKEIPGEINHYTVIKSIMIEENNGKFQKRTELEISVFKLRFHLPPSNLNQGKS